MSFKITYFTASRNQNIASGPITSETRSLSGTTALSGVTPDNSDIISIYSTENAHYAYYSASSIATTTDGKGGNFIGANERIWLDAKPGFKVAGIQVTP